MVYRIKKPMGVEPEPEMKIIEMKLDGKSFTGDEIAYVVPPDDEGLYWEIHMADGTFFEASLTTQILIKYIPIKPKLSIVEKKEENSGKDTEKRNEPTMAS